MVRLYTGIVQRVTAQLSEELRGTVPGAVQSDRARVAPPDFQ
jgi:hypothetical protein